MNTLTGWTARQRRVMALVLGAMLVLAIAFPAFAVEAGEFDWSDAITTNIAGFTAGVIASITAVFAIAVLVRLTFKAARITLKALGFIK